MRRSCTGCRETLLVEARSTKRVLFSYSTVHWPIYLRSQAAILIEPRVRPLATRTWSPMEKRISKVASEVESDRVLPGLT